MTIAPTNEAQKAEFYGALQELINSSGPNKHHQAIVMIEACIGEGVNTRPQIVAAGRAVGLNYCHVAKMLNDSAGGNPDVHLWQVDKQGIYSLHPSDTAV